MLRFKSQQKWVLRHHIHLQPHTHTHTHSELNFMATKRYSCSVQATVLCKTKDQSSTSFDCFAVYLNHRIIGILLRAEFTRIKYMQMDKYMQLAMYESHPQQNLMIGYFKYSDIMEIHVKAKKPHKKDKRLSDNREGKFQCVGTAVP